jgi:hypothetical protein
MLLGFVLVRFLPRQYVNIGLLLVVLIPFVTLALANMLPKKRCRNCGLEWRGTPRTN